MIAALLLMVSALMAVLCGGSVLAQDATGAIGAGMLAVLFGMSGAFRARMSVLRRRYIESLSETRL